MTSLIGGLVLTSPEQGVTGTRLRDMANQGWGSGETRYVLLGSGGVFGSAHGGLEESDHCLVVGDLDLTNHEELVERVGGGDHRADLLTSLYRQEGRGFVRRLRGAFAFALWDGRERTLLLAVDRFGIRRLHYLCTERQIAFASQARVVVGSADTSRRADPTAVFSFLNFGCVPAPRSAFAGVQRVPPGHLVRVRDGRPVLEPYWDMSYAPVRRRRDDAAAGLYRFTEEAVRAALRGGETKETGTFLSGGTDSSTVLGLASRLTGERINAFSIGFAEEPYDELRYARLAAERFGAAHYWRRVTPEDALEALPGLVEAFDEPLGNNSAIGTYFCARAARESGVTRLLAGDGGDEIFGGNARYTHDRLFGMYHGIPAALRRRVLEPALGMLPDGAPGPLGLLQRYVRRANIPNPARFYSYEFLVAQEAARLLSPEFLAAADLDAPYAVIRTHFDRVQASAELDRLMYLDLKVTIGDNDLLKVTRTAELAGVATRFPLLDHPLVEFTGTLPARLKVRGFEKRHLFRHAFRSLLPAEILAKRKHGFGVPTSAWLRSHPGFVAVVRDTLLSGTARQRGYFRAGAIEDLLDRHAADTTPYYGDVLWTFFMLEMWHGSHVDSSAAVVRRR